MMHLEVIIERNAKPAPVPRSAPATIGAGFVRYWRERQSQHAERPLGGKRPWDASDPLPEAEAHPR